MSPESGLINASQLLDEFVNVSADDMAGHAEARGERGHQVYKDWIDNSSAKRSDPGLFGAGLLRKLYPNHSLIISKDYNLNLLGFPGAYTRPIDTDDLITNVFFLPLARRLGGGLLYDSVEFGVFRTAWDKYEFTVYIVKYLEGFGTVTQHFILCEGSEQPARDLLLAAGSWATELHEEIWVFNQGWWNKDHELWTEVQKADWKDIILSEDFKRDLQKDVTSFFSSEPLYKKYSLPWKRGLILYGPPGNGKTISIKAIMKTVSENGYAPLYVKSFQSWAGEEAAMQQVFDQARKLAPCVLVLEDLDSLINDRNRSFFLNQLDGLVGNDGLLVIATTNHFDRLDPGLSTRPSRFDRKYDFRDPDPHERLLYAKYWQVKLKGSDAVDFPDSLAKEVADITYGFSFAYLKEVFVSSLVLLATDKDSKSTFGEVIKGQIKVLRKQLDTPTPSTFIVSGQRVREPVRHSDICPPPLPPKPDRWDSGRVGTLATTHFGRRFVY